MDRSLPLFLIGLIFGAGIGFTIAAANRITLDGHHHRDPTHHGGRADVSYALHSPGNLGQSGHRTGTAHDHDALLSLAESETAPTLALEVFRDPSSGWNVRLVTENFTFSPENASRAHVPGEGHAHVYVNGDKRDRYYGPWVHLDNLPPGQVTIEVTLNANDHRCLAVGGRPVAKTVTIAN